MENYIGRKMIGFQFEDGIDSIKWLSSKKDFIGIIGKIIRQENRFVIVNFEDDNYLVYPISMVEQHLLPIELELPKKGDRILVSNDGKRWEERIFLAYIEESIYPIIGVLMSNENEFKKGEKVPVYFWKYWKPLLEKIKLTKQEIAKKFGINVEQLEITE